LVIKSFNKKRRGWGLTSIEICSPYNFHFKSLSQVSTFGGS